MGILRGIQDVKIIMPIALVSYWLLNLPVGYLLGFTLGMGPGLYLGFAVGLSTAAVLLIARIRRSVGKLRGQLKIFSYLYANYAYDGERKTLITTSSNPK